MTTALLLAGCSDSSASPYRHTVVAGWGEPQNPLVPGNTSDSFGVKAEINFLTGLISYDPKTSEPVYENAASITTTDQQHFTITLKPGWTFSDGTPVTSSSYVDAWNYTALATNKQLNSSYFQYVQGYSDIAPQSGPPKAHTLSGLHVVSDTVFTVALNQKFSGWPRSLGSFVYDPLPTAFFKDRAAWEKKPVGDGPYRVASYTPGRELELVPYDHYAGQQHPQNQGIDLKVYTDPSAAYADLVAGNLDLVDTMPLTQLANAAADLDGRLVSTPSGTLSHLAFPLYDKGWSGERGARLRAGLSMAINRALISEKIFHGTVAPATDWTAPILGAGGGYLKGLCGEVCRYNPAMARKLVKDAGGIPHGTLTITYNADGGNRVWVEAVCNSINQVLGQDHACVGRPLPTFARFQKETAERRETGAFRNSWEMDYPLAQDFLQALYTAHGAANQFGYSSPAFDALIDKANAAPDAAAANRLYQQAERQLNHDLPGIPLWNQNSVAGYSAAVSHVLMDGFRDPVYYAIRK